MKNTFRIIIIFIMMLSLSLSLIACGAETEQTQVQSQAQTEILTPGSTEPEGESVYYSGILEISEVMVKNQSMFPVENMDYPDWIELKNISDSAVDLSEWKISEGSAAAPIICGSSEPVIHPGEYILVYASSVTCDYFTSDVSLKPNSTVSLVAPDGVSVSSVFCEDSSADVSFIPQEDGSVEVCSYPTPGLENKIENYDYLMTASSPSGPVIISEVMGGNISTGKCNTGYEDWIELRNISETELKLSDYYLSDSCSDLQSCRLPEKILKPGEYVIIWCSGDSSNSTNAYIHVDFKINATRDTVFLSDAERVIDSISYHDAPVGGTIGRGEDGKGIYVFTVPSLKAANSFGYTRVSAKPSCLAADGVYEGVESISVELSADGTVYYTIDGTNPTVSSTVYSGPITVSGATVIRAISVEEGCAPSGEAVFSFFVDKGHSLPILSLTVDDTKFSNLYYRSVKNSYAQANLALYDENGTVFNSACGFCMKGWTSLELPKKSLGVTFSGKFGADELACDVFGTGVCEYSNLSIRAGQDYTSTIVRNELMQELCLEMSDSVPTQNSKYCVLYINGNYWGIYCLKDDINKAWYAGINGVDESQVLKSRSPAGYDSSIKEFLDWCYSADMSDPANYELFCEQFDIDALIDWIIIEGYSGNTDINGNMKYFRTEDGKWKIALYDLDWALLNTNNAFNTLLKSSKTLQVYTCIIAPLLKNTEFKEKLCRRAAELLSTTLSDEHVLQVLNELIAEIEPEVAADRARWGSSYSTWETRCNLLRSQIADTDYDRNCLKILLRITGASDELKEELLATIK